MLLFDNFDIFPLKHEKKRRIVFLLGIMTDYKQIVGMLVMSLIIKNETRLFDAIIAHSYLIVVIASIYWIYTNRVYFLNWKDKANDVSVKFTSRKIMTAAGMESMTTCILSKKRAEV